MDTFLATLLALSVPIWSLVEFIKSGLIWLGVFERLTERAQTIVLQLIAFGVGVLAAVGLQTNAFVDVAAAALLPVWVAYVLTGLFAAGGSAFIHLIAAFLALRGNVVVMQTVAVPKAQVEGEIDRATYAPFA